MFNHIVKGRHVVIGAKISKAIVGFFSVSKSLDQYFFFNHISKPTVIIINKCKLELCAFLNLHLILTSRTGLYLGLVLKSCKTFEIKLVFFAKYLHDLKEIYYRW